MTTQLEQAPIDRASMVASPLVAPSSAHGLYRPQVVDAERSRLGRPTPIADVSVWVITTFMVVLMITVATYLSCTTFARKETVSGLLQSASGSARVTFGKPATISAVHVREGQAVHKGQALFTLAVDTSLDSGQTLGSLLDAATRKQNEALLEQLGASRATNDADLRGLAAKRTALHAQQSSIAETLLLQQQHLVLDQATLDGLSKIAAKGFVSAVRLREQQVQVLTDRQSLTALRQQQAQAAADLKEIEASLDEGKSTADQAEARISQQRAELDEKRAETAAQSLVVLTAPIDGRVATMRAEVGGATMPGTTLALVLPPDAQLEAELWAPSKAAGFVRPRDEVRIMYDAYPFQRFGTGSGRVISISRTPVEAAELPIAPSDTREAMYRVRVSLDRQYVAAYGGRWPLNPGARLRADLILERQSLFGWLFDPLLASRSRDGQ